MDFFMCGDLMSGLVDKLYEADFAFLYFLQGLHTPFLDRLMTLISFLGNKGWIFIVLGLVLLSFKKTRRMGVGILISLAVGLLIGNVGLKNIVARPRPCWLDASVPLLTGNPSDYSFPSGHTLAAFETAVSALLVDRRFGIPLTVLAVLMALSRLYLFVHFPTDVLSGMVLGIFIAKYVGRTIDKYRNC